MDRDDVEKARNAEREAGSEETSGFRPPTADLANLEAMLSSLAPRAAGIDRDRLMFLAGQAAALPLPLGEGRGEGEALSGMAPAHTASSQDSAALTLTLSQRERGPSGRWAWPSAFSAMTALAASLLIMLVNRPEPTVIERIVRVPADRAAEIPNPQLAGPDARALESEPPFSPARPPAVYGESYLHARDQVLAFGLDSWVRTVGPSTGSSAEPPASYRELRESLLQ